MSPENEAKRTSEFFNRSTRRTAVERLESYIGDPKNNILRDYQLEVAKALLDSLRRGETCGYISLPTGSGKTVIITEIAKLLQLKTLILSPTTKILQQTAETAAKFGQRSNLVNFYFGEKNTDG